MIPIWLQIIIVSSIIGIGELIKRFKLKEAGK